MRNACLALVAFVVVACGESREERVAPPPPPPETLAAQSFTLANGLDVELLAGPCGDTVALAALFELGADHDPAERSGMSLVVERLLAAASPAAQIESGSDHTLYSVVAPRDGLPAELTRLAETMSHVELTDAAVSEARRQVLDELARMRGGDPALTAASYAVESIQPARGGGARGGVAAELASIDLAQVDAFLKAHLRAGNARIVVVGRFDASSARAQIESAFGSLAAGTAPTLREPSSATVTGTLVMGDAPSAIAMAVPAPALEDPLYAAFLILAARLTSAPADGRTWESSYDPVARPETLFVTASVPAGEPAEPAAARTRADVAPLVEGPLVPADVTAARERFARWLGLEDLEPSACAASPRDLAVARARRAQLGVDALHLGDALSSVTDAQLREAAQRFGPARSATVIGGGEIR